MRIACAQYSPQVGDIDNNLTRADAVLAKAKAEQLDDLDLLVLPELAFTGFNFRSLQQIHPFLEPSGSGISSLWARTTALKYSTNVLVGYPEKVDVRAKWPTSPEYYNSAIMVNDDGETVFNYRKNFLDQVDQHWALESDDGFIECDMPGLGKVCVALGVDLNPYSPDAPWHAFDLAFHALEIEADVVIVCMSWLTRKEPRDFSRTLAEPDMETLTYWVQRLEPLVRAELERETIVVFCNRSGQEDDALYAGTSAVIGIKDGEVSVYGLAGRGTKEFLFVDTSFPPFAKLVQNDDNDYGGEEAGGMPDVVEMRQHSNSVDPSKWTVDPTEWPAPPAGTVTSPNTKVSSTGPAVNKTTSSNRAQPAAGAVPPKKEKPSPKLQIPNQGTVGGPEPSRGAEKESPTTIPTPTGPSPTPMAMRPKLVIPEEKVIKAGFSRKPSPFPHDNYFLEQHRFFGNRVHAQIFTPITPMEEAPQVSAQASTRFYWKPSDTLLKTPANMNFQFADTPASDSPIASKGMSLDALTPFPGEDITGTSSPAPARPGRQGSLSSINANTTNRRPSTSLKQSETLSPYEAAVSPQTGSDKSSTGGARPESRSAPREPPPIRPSNPVSRNNNNNSNSKAKEEGGSSTAAPRVESVVKQSDRLSPPRRTASAAENRTLWAEKSNEALNPVRTDSPKARHASRAQAIRADSKSGQRPENTARPPHSHAASTGISGARPPSRAGHGGQDEVRRPASRTTTRPTGGSAVRHARSRSAGDVPRNPAHGSTTGTAGHRSNSRSPPEGKRAVSRGRQRVPTGRSPPGTDSNHGSVSVTRDTKDTVLITRRVSVTRIHSASRPSGVRKATPEDDIVAVEEYVDPACEQHFQRAPSANAPQHKLPSIADGRAIVGAHCNLPPPPPVSQVEEDDDDDDSRALTPAVLGGSVKTTIITVPAGKSLETIASPLQSANSIASTTYQTSETSKATPASGSTTPDNSRFPNKTPTPVVAARLVTEEKWVDTPVSALVCETCGSPRVASHLEDGAARPRTNFW